MTYASRLAALVAAAGHKTAVLPGAEQWDPTSLGTNLALSNGGKTVTKTATVSSFSSVRSVTPFPAGQDRYFAAAVVDPSAQPYQQTGIATTAMPTTGATAWPGSSANAGYSYDEEKGDLLRSGSPIVTAFGSTWRTSANILIAYKGSTNQLFVRLNGVWQHSGDPSTGANGITTVAGTYYAAFAMYGRNTACTLDATTVDSDPLLSGFIPLAV